jgi:hypothetical protein
MTTSKRLRQLADRTGLYGFADELRAMADEMDAAAQAVQEPLGFMNAGNIHEMHQGRMPYGYVYPEGEIGASVAIYTAPRAQPAPQQKPVAWMYEGEYSSGSYSGNYFEWRVTTNKNATNAARKVKPLYTTPPAQPEPRQWVGLTDMQIVDAIQHLYKNRAFAEMATEVSMDDFRLIEAKLKELNNG